MTRSPLSARVLLVLAGLVLGGGLLGASPAQAHQPGATLVTVAALPISAGGAAAVRLSGSIPLGRLDFAYGTGLVSPDPQAVLDAHRVGLTALVADRVGLADGDGAAWTTTVDSLSISRSHGRAVLVVTLTAVATHPAGAASASAAQARALDLRWDVVTDVVYSHRVFVGGQDAEGTTTYAGELTHVRPTLRLSITPAGAQGDLAVVTLFDVGFEHFREGTDHLLFLCLVALAAARRRGGLRRTVPRLAALTVMFTLGHSTSLALATMGLVSLPSRCVEVGIALTIVATAAHAVRPTLPMRVELLLTGLFGLMHGFGFAGTLTDLDIRGADLVVPLLSFNVGLEAAQLAALALLAFPLFVMARSGVATLLLASAVGVVASAWVAQRAFGVNDPLDNVVAYVAGSPERLALSLLLGVLALALVKEVGAAPAPHSLSAPVGRGQ